jgi:aldehyde:ferredoxin oxidoreductase
MYGYTGNILHVDLTTQQLDIEEPDEAFYRQYVGGGLIGLYYLWKNCPAGTDPLSPNNTLTFAISAPTGLPVSGQSRCTVTCKSPSSGGIADAQAGGFWPAELKYAGFDAIVVKGASDKPVYLWVNDGHAELRDASHLWGKKTGDVDKLLKETLNDKRIEIAQIGISGEKLAIFASIMSMSNRTWGRTGVGAVMGSKKLKAIVVRGTQRATPADKQGITAIHREGAKRLTGSSMEGWARYGTIGGVMGQNADGGLPTHNWDSGIFEGSQNISGERLYDELLRGAEEGKQDKLGRDTCYSCFVRCKRVVESKWREKDLKPEYGGPEYETTATFGSYCGIDDLHAVAYANQLCNEYGADTISCGATLSWAMECFEKGLLTLSDTEGIELRYGNVDGMIAMLEKILNREGFGDVLAEGSAKAADRLGIGHEYLSTVKGQEMPAHMPQVKRGLGLIYAVNPFGADHQSSEHDPMYEPAAYEGNEKWGGYKEMLAPIGLTKPQPARVLNEEKVEFALKTQYNYSAMNAISLCQFVYGPGWQFYGPNVIAQLLQSATGWEVTVDDIQAIGRRHVNFMRAFNAREGLSRAQDGLPKKLFRKALRGGASDGVVLSEAEMEAGLDMYFTQAGWDVDSGVPTRTTLIDCGLEWIADELGLK